MTNDHLDSCMGRGKTTTTQNTPTPWKHESWQDGASVVGPSGNESKEFEEIVKQIQKENNDTDNPTMTTSPQHTPTTEYLLERLQEVDESAEWNNLEGSAVFTPDEYGEIVHRVTVHAALVEALEQSTSATRNALAMMERFELQGMREHEPLVNAFHAGLSALAAAKGTR